MTDRVIKAIDMLDENDSLISLHRHHGAPQKQQLSKLMTNFNKLVDMKHNKDDDPVEFHMPSALLALLVQETVDDLADVSVWSDFISMEFNRIVSLSGGGAGGGVGSNGSNGSVSSVSGISNDSKTDGNPLYIDSISRFAPQEYLPFIDFIRTHPNDFPAPVGFRVIRRLIQQVDAENKTFPNNGNKKDGEFFIYGIVEWPSVFKTCLRL